MIWYILAFLFVVLCVCAAQSPKYQRRIIYPIVLLIIGVPGLAIFFAELIHHYQEHDWVDISWLAFMCIVYTCSGTVGFMWIVLLSDQWYYMHRFLTRDKADEKAMIRRERERDHRCD